MCEHCHEAKDTKKKKKYLIEYEELMKEYDKEANKGLDPSKLTSGSDRKIWWICPLGHHYDMSISNRIRPGNGCPYCSGHRVLKGYNDVATIYPELIKEFDLEANKGTDLSKFTCGSHKKAWWICSLGHKYKMSIYNKVKGKSCPYCANKKVLKDFNDLATTHPELILEWHNEKNIILPTELVSGSNKKVWWKCAYGHEWTASPYTRIHYHTNCPYCTNRTSFQECAIKYYLDKLSLDVQQSYKEFGFEIDLYIPNLKVAIEYDGGYWHKDRIKQDLEKNKKRKNLNITLYRIRENISSLNDTSIDICYNIKYNSLDSIIYNLLNNIYPNHNINVDIKKDECQIRQSKKYSGHGKTLTIEGITKSLKQWAIFFGFSYNHIRNYIWKHGLQSAIDYFTKLYKIGYYKDNDKLVNNRGKVIVIQNIKKNYEQWGIYFGRSKNWVTKTIERYGLPTTIDIIEDFYRLKQQNQCLPGKITKKYLTKLYKQKQKSTQKDNIAA